MTARDNEKGKPKGKSKVRGLVIVLIIVAFLAVGGGIGWWFLSKEHREAANLPLDAVDFARLNDGVYSGEYAGGMYKWRANACRVTVANGTVTDIQLLSGGTAGSTDYVMLYDRVVDAQSLQVDTISGATLTSKGYLQCVENALIPAQKN